MKGSALLHIHTRTHTLSLFLSLSLLSLSHTHKDTHSLTLMHTHSLSDTHTPHTRIHAHTHTRKHAHAHTQDTQTMHTILSKWEQIHFLKSLPISCLFSFVDEQRYRHARELASGGVTRGASRVTSPATPGRHPSVGKATRVTSMHSATHPPFGGSA